MRHTGTFTDWLKFVYAVTYHFCLLFHIFFGIIQDYVIISSANQRSLFIIVFLTSFNNCACYKVQFSQLWKLFNKWWKPIIFPVFFQQFNRMSENWRYFQITRHLNDVLHSVWNLKYKHSRYFILVLSGKLAAMKRSLYHKSYVSKKVPLVRHSGIFTEWLKFIPAVTYHFCNLLCHIFCFTDTSSLELLLLAMCWGNVFSLKAASNSEMLL